KPVSARLLMATATANNLMDEVFNPPIDQFALPRDHTSSHGSHQHAAQLARHDSNISHQSRRSEISQSSRVSNNNGYHNGYAAIGGGARPREPSQRSAQPSVVSEDILNQIFSNVHLAPVEYTNTPRSYEQEAMRHIDEVLQHESETPEPASPAPQSRRSSQHSQHSRHSHHSGARGIHMPDLHIDEDDHFHHHAQQSPHGYRDRVHTGESTLSGRSDASTLKGHESEEYDTFHPQLEPRRNFDRVRRGSEMTIDSSVSMTESRFGDFPVHDSEGHMQSQEVNLEHDEVAYERIKKKKSPMVADVPTGPVHTGDTWRLRQLNDELNSARHRQTILEQRVRQEQKEVDELRRRQPSHQQSRHTTRTNSQGSHQHNNNQHHYDDHHQYDAIHHSRTSTIYSEIRPASVQKSVSGDSIVEEVVGISQVAERVKDHGQIVNRVNGIDLIIPYHEVVQGYAKNPKVRKVVFGGALAASPEDKTVLLFGPVGAGKSTLIDSILDYLYDVRRENEFRFVATANHAPTTELTVYEFNNTIFPFKVTIVDTPGIPDVKGNKVCSSLIQHWLKTELLASGAFRLDAISIVLTHDEVNLGWPFIYELAAVRQMFGGDLKTNVLPIITHSEVLPQPLAIRSLAQANIAFVEYYKVNNSGFFADPHGVPKLKHNLFFKHGIASLELFFRDLQEMIHPLLAVLRHQSPAGGPKSPVFENADLY
ncbi:unnamed protein product, partial [Mesorhabditis belari]|uniref:G domain-containing protein n=1 Tax=Mesorhabditis belari TaxID=2138241 RepID=A0AAF3FJ77_9BILA